MKMAVSAACSVISKALCFTSARSLSANLQTKGIVGVLGIPFNKGQPKGGVEGGPALIRKHGLVPELETIGWHVKDYGDMEFHTVPHDTIGKGLRHPRTCGNAMQQISEAVHGIMAGEGLCVALGGDHSIAIGTVHGHLQASPESCVIWIDAHADLNTPNTSHSGNVHGMPLSFLLRELESEVQAVKDAYQEWSWLKPCISVKDVCFIGLRDVDAGEQEAMKRLNIPHFSMYEVDKYGIAETVRLALKAVNPHMDRPIHLSYDVDALDPATALSTGTPVVGGLTLREGFYIAEEIAATGLLNHMDMVEVNPKLADQVQSDITAKSALRIITSCLGARIV